MRGILYTTVEPTRWDTVAYAMYGNVGMVPELIQANQQLPIYTVIPTNVVLFIPVFENVVRVNSDLLPPWKRDVSY